MKEENNNKIEVDKEVQVDENGSSDVSVSQNKKEPFSLKKNIRKPMARKETKERVKPEFDQKVIDIRRVTRVVTGGRRFSFSVAVVVGDRKGRVGVGLGKANDTTIAIDKAVRDAKKHLVRVPLTETGSILHEVDAKYSSAWVKLMRAPGKGVLAGSSVRVVFDLLGAKEVGAKIFSRSKNKINIANATLKALSLLKKSK